MELAVKAGDAAIEAWPFDWEKLNEEDWQESRKRARKVVVEDPCYPPAAAVNNKGPAL
jgi:hypothetical protein